MVKIILDKEAKKFIQGYFNTNINKIILQSNDNNLFHLCEMVRDLLDERAWSDLAIPYKYDGKNKELIFYGKNSLDDALEKLKKLEEK